MCWRCGGRWPTPIPGCPAPCSRLSPAPRTSRRRRWATPSAAKATLPFLEDSLERARALMGADFWSYGVAGNEKTLDTFLGYHHAQGLSPAPGRGSRNCSTPRRWRRSVCRVRNFRPHYCTASGITIVSASVTEARSEDPPGVQCRQPSNPDAKRLRRVAQRSSPVLYGAGRHCSIGAGQISPLRGFERSRSK